MLRGLFRTKNLNDILKNIGGPQFALKRTLGAFNVTLGVVGLLLGIIGSVLVAKTALVTDDSE